MSGILHQKPLSTSRLFIREATREDGAFFIRLLNSPGWLEHIGDRHIQSIRDARQYIENSLMDSYDTNGYGLFVVVLKATKEAVGICGYVKRAYLDHADLGFAILPEYEGQGLIREAASALLELGREKLEFKRILAITTQQNDRSQRVLKRLGFGASGTITPPEQSRSFLVFSYPSDTTLPTAQKEIL